MKFLLVLSALFATASGECVVGGLDAVKLTTLASTLLADQEAQICAGKAVMGLLDKSDFCGADSCGKVITVAKDVLEIDGPDGKKFSDCTTLSAVGGLLDTVFEQKDKICSMTKLDMVCHLSTVTGSLSLTGFDVEFDVAKCTMGASKYVCEADAGACKGKSFQCPGDKTAMLVQNTVRTALDECATDKTAASCKDSFKKAGALLKTLIPDTLPQDTAQANKRIAQGVCVFEGLKKLKDEVKAELLAGGMDAVKGFALNFAQGQMAASGNEAKWGAKIKWLGQLSAPNGVTTVAADVGVTTADLTAEEATQAQAVDAATTEDEATDTGSATAATVSIAAVATVAAGLFL